MSSIVAVAGGSRGLGRAIVEAILADNKYHVFILSRQTSEEGEKEIGARFLQVDYSDIDNIKTLLEHHKIDTVISALSAKAIGLYEVNLAVASEKSTVTTSSPLPFGPPKAAVMDFLKTTDLEYSAWYTGFFIDYYVSPPLKSPLDHWTVFIDITNRTAALPGSGDVPVAMSYTMDVAKFVAGSLSLSKWERETLIYNDKLTMNQYVQVIEEVRGEKIQVTYDSLDLLKSGKITELPSHPPMYEFVSKDVIQSFLAAFGILFETGEFDLREGYRIQDGLPSLKLQNFRDLLTQGQ
ncbi:Oxidoreductase BOA1 [Fusarium oxysporum f. sp. cubense]|uniref:Oxidoreductase BOA1 n=1 Tax=Fusarium oxysporum f. sp. cubense TaxID=61366 RepID=A0A559KT21_FUSOC|nr:Oxidoreductase BOA1 [Fusarium oxysporum f. sp. cubense]